ncbi:MAG TPA: protease inhibitor I9 family protein, partial [Terriglobales bacterium]|nr:protease inhibitor I9 family protein [Terriglobales bacterium]
MIFRARTLRTTMCAAMMFSMAWTTLARGELEKVHSQVLEAVRKKGHASVLVGIKVPWKMEQTLNQADVMTQRQAIRAAQESLVSELDGTEYRIVREYQKIPGIALEIWPDALSILEKSDKVTNVVPDHPIITVTAEQPAPAPPSQSRTVRKVT